MTQLTVVPQTAAVPVETDSRLTATHMSLYPTMGSLHEAVAYIEGQLPLAQPNELFPLLMIYHNSLIKELTS